MQNKQTSNPKTPHNPSHSPATSCIHCTCVGYTFHNSSLLWKRRLEIASPTRTPVFVPCQASHTEGWMNDTPPNWGKKSVLKQVGKSAALMAEEHGSDQLSIKEPAGNEHEVQNITGCINHLNHLHHSKWWNGKQQQNRQAINKQTKKKIQADEEMVEREMWFRKKERKMTHMKTEHRNHSLSLSFPHSPLTSLWHLGSGEDKVISIPPPFPTHTHTHTLLGAGVRGITRPVTCFN